MVARVLCIEAERERRLGLDERRREREVQVREPLYTQRVVERHAVGRRHGRCCAGSCAGSCSGTRGARGGRGGSGGARLTDGHEAATGASVIGAVVYVVEAVVVLELLGGQRRGAVEEQVNVGEHLHGGRVANLLRELLVGIDLSKELTEALDRRRVFGVMCVRLELQQRQSSASSSSADCVRACVRACITTTALTNLQD